MIKMNGTRVLLVDDDDLSLRLVSRLLESAGYHVTTAMDAGSAMHIVLNENVQLIVADWEMPGTNGLELCRSLRSVEGVGFVYIVMLTAHSDEDRLVQAFQAGADDYVIKPSNKKELLARLRAGQRIIALHNELESRTLHVAKLNAEAETAFQRLQVTCNQLGQMAAVDDLTGLLNRRAGIERLHHAWNHSIRNSTSLCCILVDIDHFKKVNDTYGHHVGDIILRGTAATLNRVSRSTDTVCRIGGEEFLVICADTTLESAKIAAERMRRAVEETVHRHDDTQIKVTISLGVTERSLHHEDPNLFVQCADAALYKAKENGRNRIEVDLGSPELADSTVDKPMVEPANPIMEPLAELVLGGADESVPATGPGSLHSLSGRVLLISENNAPRPELVRLLESEGHTLCIAGSVTEAVAEPNAAPDIVILDYSDSAPSDEIVKCLGVREHWQHFVPAAMIIRNSAAAPNQRKLISLVDEVLPWPIAEAEFVARIRLMVRLSRSHQALVRSTELRGEQTRVMSLLLEFSRSVSVSSELSDIIQHTVAVAGELLCCRRVSVLMPDVSRSFLQVVGGHGNEIEPVQTLDLPLGSGISGEVFSSGEHMVLTGDEATRRLSTARDGILFEPGPILSAPLASPEHIIGVLNVSARIQDRSFETQEVELLDLIANMAASAIHDVLARESRDEARDSIVVALAKLAEHRDDDTGSHVERVTQFCLVLARSLRTTSELAGQIDDEFLRQLERAVPLHDIGKVAIPDAILQKPGRLTHDEMAIMQTHSAIGREVIRTVRQRTPGTSFLKMAEEIAHSHHERWDGDGYPQGIAGEVIPLSARIVTLADVYDAITTQRVYKKAMPHYRAVEIIREGSGTQFDPRIVETFLGLTAEFERLADELSGGAEAGARAPIPLVMQVPSKTPILAAGPATKNP